MLEKILSFLPATLVAISIGPLLYRTWQKKVEPAFSSWLLWSVIGFVLLISYGSCGSERNLLPSIFGWINPTVMSLLLWRQCRAQNKPWLKSFTPTERVGGAVAFIAIAIWFYYQTTLPFVALLMALVANTIAAWPTIKRVFKKPNLDRPTAWTLFTLGFALNTISAASGDIAEWLLPAYMTLFGGMLAIQLTWYRVRMRTPLKEWV